MNSRQAHVDSADIEQCAKTLESLAARARAFDDELMRRLDILGDTFQDDAYDRFRAQVERSRLLIKTLVGKTDEVLPQLRKDAETIRAAEALKH
jgi:uncharacterized protein YukE